MEALIGFAVVSAMIVGLRVAGYSGVKAFAKWIDKVL